MTSQVSLRRLVVSAALGSITLLLAPPAKASPESDAKDLFARGRELRNANDCGSAAPLFRKAWTIFPQGLGSLRNLAECEEQLGHFASSRRAWLDLKRALVTAPNDPKYDGWDKDAEDAATRLKAKVASFVVDVYVRSPEGELLANDHTGVEIFVNGESVGTSLVGTPLERDPGTYRIRAQMADAQPVEQTVALSAGDNPHVSIRLTRTPAAVPAAPRSSNLRTVGWIALGVGGASLIGAGVTFLVRQSSLSELEDKCGGAAKAETGPCPTSLQGTVDTGKLMSVLSPILLGVGVVGAGAGAVLIFTSPSSSTTQGKGLFVTPGFGRVDATWRF
ncbi:MAG TPA: tetratricopeptide repeat protein [Labilithrix sp.]|nr:tetratricopeptide repeat protein [Labilithrix sp.]